MTDLTTTHAEELPYPRGTLVEDSETGRRGHLMGMLVEKHKFTGRLVSQEVFARPLGGGCEWSAPSNRIKPVKTGGAGMSNCIHVGVRVGQRCPRCKEVVGVPAPTPEPQRRKAAS